jgi:sulfatase maturation enzyme AslB (radical SAM superfamily)
MINHVGVIRLPIDRLHVELTNICNFSCHFCPDAAMQRPRGMISLDLAQSILDDVSHSGAVRLVLFHVMGEPTLHPHLVEIAKYAQRRKVEVCITTNGSRLQEDMLTALCRAGVKQIIVSLQTPDAKTFAMRGAKELSFAEYADRITTLVHTVLNDITGNQTEICISFLTSPLRRLIIPLFEEYNIIDTTPKLREHLRAWAERLLKGTSAEHRLPETLQRIQRATVFRQNHMAVTERLSFQTRIVGDWGNHFQQSLVKARFGYCPGLQENVGILWNGDYVFCCTDYDGRTSTANHRDMSLMDYLNQEVVQQTVRGFQDLKITHPHCQSCMGDSSYLKAIGKQIGSILYFKYPKSKKSTVR